MARSIVLTPGYRNEGLAQPPQYYLEKYLTEPAHEGPRARKGSCWAEDFCGALAVDDAARESGMQVSAEGVRLLAAGEISVAELKAHLISVDSRGQTAVQEPEL